MVEWLEELDYGVESGRKIVISSSGFAMGRLETLSVDPAVNGYLFRIREGLGSERRGIGSTFHQLCLCWSLTPTAPTAIRLWETSTPFTLTTDISK